MSNVYWNGRPVRALWLIACSVSWCTAASCASVPKQQVYVDNYTELPPYVVRTAPGASPVHAGNMREGVANDKQGTGSP